MRLQCLADSSACSTDGTVDNPICLLTENVSELNLWVQFRFAVIATVLHKMFQACSILDSAESTATFFQGCLVCNKDRASNFCT